jgi:hypothetical protein
MHFHLPKPLHGWREFAGEVGIIVVGVLIALGAEQLVEAAHWRSEVRDFRAAVDHELGRDFGIYAVNMENRSCVQRRIADLQKLLDGSSGGHQPRLREPIGRPANYTFYFSVWDNKSADVTAHLPLNVRIGYAEFYDDFRNADQVRDRELNLWRSLSQFEQAEPFTHDDRMRFRELLTRVIHADLAERNNYDYEAGRLRAAGIAPIADPYASQFPNDPSFCRPLIANGAVTKH